MRATMRGAGRGGFRCTVWLAAVYVGAVWLHGQAAPPPAAAPLDHHAYVWQRAWTEPVRVAVRAHAPAFTQLSVLAAEVTFSTGGPAITYARIDWTTLQAVQTPVGLVVRVGHTVALWNASAPQTLVVLQACRTVLADAERAGVRVAELQLDHDAAAARLADYTELVQLIRRQIHPPRLTLTTLPAWLAQADFRSLVAAADSFVLQVHSLDKPTTADGALTLCDPDRAAAWIAQAAEAGRPFRIALPTYGYRVVFAGDGRFLGLEAETPTRAWPVGAQSRLLLADPAAIFRLVARLQARRPRTCEGVIWFRLPVSADTRAWRWPTLATVMAGREPQPRLRLRTEPTADGAATLLLVNDGTADAFPATLHLTWASAALIGADGVGAWRIQREPGGLKIVAPGAPDAARVPAGDTVRVGWVRLDRPAEIALRSASSDR